MAATESATTAPTDVSSTPVEETPKSVEKLTKAEKPDEEKFKKDIAEAEKQLSSITEKMSALRIKIDGSSGKGPNSARITELRGQLDAIKEKQAALKSGKSGIQQQLDSIKAKIEREQNDLKAKRGKINYRSVDEIDREIKELEKEVDSGKLKLVDEKKNLKRMSDLKGIRKQMAVFTTAEESIKADITKRKALQDELSSSTQTPEAKALSEEYNKIRDEMTKLKSENDDAYAKRGELRSQRDELQKQRDKAYENKKAVQDEYYKQRDAYRLWNDQNRKAQSEKYWKTREEEEKARLEHNAAARLDEASQEAYATQIWKCENLLRLFGGAEGPAIPPPKTSASVPAAPEVRVVEKAGLTKITSKKDREAEEFLPKKKQAPKAAKTTVKSQSKKSFVLSMDVMKTLGELGVTLPTNEENVKITVEELKQKLTYYKDNQERATQENIAKAKKDNEDIERKAMAQFNEKKEADLSGKKNAPRGKKATPASKGKGKDKVNGNTNGTTAAAPVEKENGVVAEGEEVKEKEGTPETS